MSQARTQQLCWGLASVGPGCSNCSVGDVFNCKDACHGNILQGFLMVVMERIILGPAHEMDQGHSRALLGA